MTLRAVSPSVGGGGTTVTSVNGQSGDVVLDAADVGAVASVSGTMVDNTDPLNPVILSDPTKVSTSSTANVLYGTASGGVQTTVTYSTSPTQSTVVYRTATGQIQAATPTTDAAVTTKLYVDTQITNSIRAQLVHIEDAVDATDVVTKFNALLADLIAKNYMAAA